MYAVNAIQHFHARFPNRKLAFFYDVGCKLHPHLLKHGQEPPYILMVPKLHAYCHDKGCQSRFSAQACMGVGSFDGEGSERVWSALAPVIGSTHRQTVGNRQLSIAISLEKNDSFKVKRIPSLIQKSLNKALRKLADLNEAHVQDEIYQSGKGYLDTIKNNRDSRKRAYTIYKVKDSEHDSKYLLRLKLDQEASQIRSIERNLRRGRSGTTITSKLKRKVKKHQANFKHYLDLYNDFDTTRTQPRVHEAIRDLNLFIDDNDLSSDDENVPVYPYHRADFKELNSSARKLPDKLTAKEVF
ncbi:hypothetical protein BC829DRAFT_376981, partial [Chytridium lagenaria]